MRKKWWVVGGIIDAMTMAPEVLIADPFDHPAQTTRSEQHAWDRIHDNPVGVSKI